MDKVKVIKRARATLARLRKACCAGNSTLFCGCGTGCQCTCADCLCVSRPS